MPPLIRRPAAFGRPGILITIQTRTCLQSTVQTRSNSTTATTEANQETEPTTPNTRRGRPFIHFKRQSDPLRILFCGSDAFSCASLRALHDLKLSDPKGKLIKSIDVLVRPGKPTGRGLKRIAIGPLFHLAEELGLPVHKRDTFTGWDLPAPGHITHPETGEVVKHRAAHENSHRQPFNLIVAVSFGLFVPPRILGSVRYGGLNVHPSLLPDLRGPAPLQHALLCGRRHTGATVQTLHHKDFDRGDILAQTPYPPGITVPEGCDVQQLHDLLAGEGARLLVETLRGRLHVPPYNDDASTAAGWRPDAEDLARGLVRDAPKVRKPDAEVDWGCGMWGRDAGLYPGGWTAADLARRFRAVGVKLAGEGAGGGGLWTRAVTARQPGEKRVIFEDVTAVRCPDKLRDVVLAIAEARAAPQTVAPETLVPKEISGVVFSMKNEQGAQPTSEFRLPYMVGVDGTSVILPIKVQYAIIDGEVSATLDPNYLDAVRIETIKTEGSQGKPASKAMAEFQEGNLTMRDLSSLDFAMDVMTRDVS